MLGFRADVKYFRRELLWTIYKANVKGDVSTIDDISQVLACDRKSVLSHIKALQSSGHISVSPGKGRDTSEYEILEAGHVVINRLIEDVLLHAKSSGIPSIHSATRIRDI